MDKWIASIIVAVYNNKSIYYTIIHAVLRQSIQRWPISGSYNYTACCRGYDVIVKVSSETRAITVAIDCAGTHARSATYPLILTFKTHVYS